jgi:hypothetical protein
VWLRAHPDALAGGGVALQQAAGERNSTGPAGARRTSGALEMALGTPTPVLALTAVPFFRFERDLHARPFQVLASLPLAVLDRVDELQTSVGAFVDDRRALNPAAPASASQ